MDILKLIEEQIKIIKAHDHSAYLDQIFSHLTRAEFYYKQGANDEQYFNDVIYRSNQAYEGALREAYKVLAKKHDDELSKAALIKIETHFKENKIFRERVLRLFENYRQEWRNKSTHDYKLIFREDEAFMALTNVSSFVHLLLKEIQEKIAFQSAIKLQELRNRAQELQRKFKDIDTPLIDKVVKVLFEFSEGLPNALRKLGVDEIETRGILHAFLTKVSDNISIELEPAYFLSGRMLIPDFLIESNGEKVILEVKRNYQPQNIQAAKSQLMTYLRAANLTDGIVYFFDTKSVTTPNLIKEALTQDEKNYNLAIVTTLQQ